MAGSLVVRKRDSGDHRVLYKPAAIRETTCHLNTPVLSCCFTQPRLNFKNLNSLLFFHPDSPPRNFRMKRFRVPSSSGFTEDGVLNPTMAAAAFNSTVPPFTAQQMDSEVSPAASFSVSDTAVEEDGENVGNFLERCFLCKKMLNQKNEVYMYGIFQAFCTPECRDKQIDIDRRMKKDCKQSGGASAGSSRKSKNQSGSHHPGRHAAVQFHI